ncbi:efflux transporter, RND family, MFP subunit [Rippkaea orientalis PCC 8801]|uniref:Efflux transporter, RND family, MFP subunit n=1 Tax=Rippkaea orientalis (strain PCC 8801 / RF-1) TaxID=41431 RepID=B7JXE9_RIPO1|nr:efflux RND transporter periplasmic adaptor subunit [Rippkaea orientalis]ACK67137.1 efflux transporter, RND family, MFP subunit [Rippkaea orientalis PCC 8801]
MLNHPLPLFQKFLGTALVLSLVTTACSSQEQKASAPQSIPVKLQTLQPGTLIDSSQFVGTLEARERVNLAPSRTNGRIVRIFVKEGDVVSRGQKLVEIQPYQEKEDVRAAIGNLQVAQADLRVAEAEYRQREAERDQAQAQVEQARANVARAEADVQDAQAEFTLAEQNYPRSKFLYETGAVSKGDETRGLDQAIRNLDTRQAQLKSRLQIRDAEKAALQAAIDNFRASQKRVEQSFANIDSAKSAIVRAQGQLGSTSETLDYNFLTAPINGVVGSFIDKKVGDNVNVGEGITTLTDNQVFNLNVGIPTENRNRLRQGLPVEIINPDGTPGVRGQITYIAPLVEQNAQAIQVKMTFRNDGSLRDKQYVQVRVIWQQQPGVLVPTAAVSSLGGQKFVFMAQSGQSGNGKTSLVAKQIPVKVGAIQGQSYQVISGLKPGDRIAVSRILDLRDGRPIQEESLRSQK